MTKSISPAQLLPGQQINNIGTRASSAFLIMSGAAGLDKTRWDMRASQPARFLASPAHVHSRRRTEYDLFSNDQQKDHPKAQPLRTRRSMKGVCHTDAEEPPEIGLIQSCGYVLAFEEDPECSSGMRIVCASDNMIELPWVHASSQSELLGQDLGRVFRAECLDTVSTLVGRQKHSREPRADFISAKIDRNSADIFPLPPACAELQQEAGTQSKGVTLTLVRSNPGLYLLDLEPKHGLQKVGDERKPVVLRMTDLLGYIPVGLSPVATTASLCDALAEAFPAYDRVMVYRFAADGAGEVIHESVKPGADIQPSYLHLRCAADDIVPIARTPFKRDGTRFIADTFAPCVPISALHERVASLDLSGSAFRAPAENHLGYLRNMGVKASLGVIISAGDELWGALVFHSYKTPVHPSFEDRVLVSTAAAVASSHISVCQQAEIATTSLSLLQVLARLNIHPRVNDFLAAEHGMLRQILDVDTIVLCEYPRSLTVFGSNDVSLTRDECAELRDQDARGDIILFRTLGDRGVAFFFVASVFVAFVRRGVARHIAWAGELDERRNVEEDMRPSTSFGSYTETVATEFEAWSPASVDLLNSVRRGISSKLHADALPTSRREVFANLPHKPYGASHGAMGSLGMLDEGRDTMATQGTADIYSFSTPVRPSDNGYTERDIGHRDGSITEVAGVPFAASKPIMQTIEAMSPFAANKSVDLVADIGPAENAIEVVGDKRRIKSILQNLVTNAIKFTPAGGTVRVSLAVHDSLHDAIDRWNQDADRFDAKVTMRTPEYNSAVDESLRSAKWHVYCVEDSGLGLRPADLPHVGAAYRQGSQGASSKYAGTGLGLHICKHHVDAMLGNLRIASTVSEGSKSGGGTLFAVVLPLRPAEAVAAGGDYIVEETVPALQRAPASPAYPNIIGSRSIAFLVVDDETVNRKLLVHKILQWFKRCGGADDVQVLLATDGLMALDVHAAARSVRVDGPALAGIFMDMYLPSLDGVECTRRIRKIEAENGWTRTMICGCTAHPSEQVRDCFLQAGADDVLSKPWYRGQVEAACSAMVAKAMGSLQSEA